MGLGYKPLNISQPFPALLEKRDFSFASAAPSMVSPLGETLPKKDTKDILIKEVLTAQDFSEWIIPLQEGFDSSEEGSRLYEELSFKTIYENKIYAKK